MPRLLALLALAASTLLSPSLFAQDGDGTPPQQFDRYWMVFLIRGDHPPELSEEAGAELQKQHLGHLSKVWRSGHALVAGPFEVPAEDALRGIVLYRGDLDEDEVRELAEADPAVQAGRLKVEIRRWWTGGGVLRFRNAEELEALKKGSGDAEE